MSVELFDSHVHSCHSHDSRQTLEQICRSAMEKGLRGVAVTDHGDMWYLKKDNTFEEIAASVRQAEAADRAWGSRLRVFRGVELSECLDDPENARKLLRLADYDVVLGSVHCVRFAEWDDAYSRICFDQTVPEEKIAAFLGAYFRLLRRMAEQEDFDVLSHLTCPLRYINGKYRRGMRLEPYQEEISAILECVIRRRKALEVNTSGIRGLYECLMPDEAIITRYYAMGGRRVTLGSDAHTPERIGNAFSETIALLKRIGFTGYYYHEKRVPRYIPFD